MISTVKENTNTIIYLHSLSVQFIYHKCTFQVRYKNVFII